MIVWFQKHAPIRSKFKALNSTYAGLAAATLLAAAVAGAPVLALAMIVMGWGALLVVSTVSAKLICDPYVATVERMEGLAAGDLESPVQFTDNRDCVGRLTAAMETFRQQAMAATDGETVKQIVRILSTALQDVAAGDLTSRISEPFAGEYDSLRVTFNGAVEGLETSLIQVASSAQNVHSGSSEIRAASEDLSCRTEQQAASLEETTAAMGEVTDMVAGTAHGAGEVRTAVNAAQRDATDGASVVQRAVGAMGAIERSAQEIEQIINVIDGISFQTNLLALNAGVEAARAGDAGKGFAVVANEVRALAQRSADAAKDIKSLINNSSQQVTEGVKLVDETGAVLSRISSTINEINTLVDTIADSAETQASNLRQVNSAVSDMDKMTQQNAAMVEESTAAARSLASQADELASLVGSFKLGRNGRGGYQGGQHNSHNSYGARRFAA